jgi:hypothetical protein
MRQIVSVGLIFMMTMAVSSSPLVAQSGGTMTGVARGKYLQSVSGVNVQLRNLNTGELAGVTVTTDAGTFTFTALPAGNYIVEVVDAAGKILGTGAPASLAAGGTATTSVIALGFGATTAASSASGFSFFGMGPVTTLTVLGAASAASVTAVVATRPDASPSR